jgi:hypothetical protein
MKKITITIIIKAILIILLLIVLIVEVKTMNNINEVNDRLKQQQLEIRQIDYICVNNIIFKCNNDYCDTTNIEDKNFCSTAKTSTDWVMEKR